MVTPKFSISILLVASLAKGLPSSLSETGLYSNTLNKTVASGNRLYVPQYPLWTDGAVKKRWIYLPPNSQINSGLPNNWIFPVGTKFWKEFSFAQKSKLKRIETRLMEKISVDEWQFASYIWNDSETEATLASEEGIKDYVKTGEKTYHDIPSTAQCLRCHRRGGDGVLGFDALQLSVDRDPLALQAEKAISSALTLKELIDKKVLTYVGPEIHNASPRIQSRSLYGRAVMGYFHANCASCHNPYGSSMHINLNFLHRLETMNEISEPSYATAVNRYTQVFAIPNHKKTFRIKKGEPDISAVVVMMENMKTSHMPPIGTNIKDQKAINLIRKWILSLR